MNRLMRSVAAELRSSISRRGGSIWPADTSSEQAGLPPQDPRSRLTSCSLSFTCLSAPRDAGAQSTQFVPFAPSAFLRSGLLDAQASHLSLTFWWPVLVLSGSVPRLWYPA